MYYQVTHLYGNSSRTNLSTYRAMPMLADKPGESMPMRLIKGGEVRSSRIVKSDFPLSLARFGRTPVYAHSRSLSRTWGRNFCVASRKTDFAAGCDFGVALGPMYSRPSVRGPKWMPFERD